MAKKCPCKHGKKKSVSLSIGRGEKSKKGGLTAKGRAKYNRATGSNLKAPQAWGWVHVSVPSVLAWKETKDQWERTESQPVKRWHYADGNVKWLNEDCMQTYTPRESVSKLALVRRWERWVLRALPPPLLLRSQRKQQNLTRENHQEKKNDYHRIR